MTGSSRFSVEYSPSRNAAVFRRLDLGVTSLASEEWHRLTQIDIRNKLVATHATNCFNVHDRTSRLDEDGLEFPDLESARREAVLTCGDIH